MAFFFIRLEGSNSLENSLGEHNIINDRSLITLFVIPFLLSSCSGILGDADSQKPDLNLSVEEVKLINASNEFGFNLLKNVNVDEIGDDLFISPISVSMALGMTYNGADGKTKDAMRDALHLGDMTDDEINRSYKSLISLLLSLDPEVAMALANSIWHRDNVAFEKAFLDLAREFFDAEVRGLDFSASNATDIINSWIEDKTNGIIKETLIPPIPPLAVMYLINAIYFKGTWTIQFDKEKTRDWTFYTSSETQSTVKMMSLREEFPYYENDELQMVDLPYGNGDFSMTIVLPKKEKNIDALISEMSSESWNLLTSKLSPDTGDILLPRFKLEYKTELIKPLTAMGMGIAFSAGLADFSKMRSQNDIFISRVLHKSFVEVNEEGTEAAAVTVVEMSYTSVGPIQGFSMIVNRPFLFVIRENRSGTIMFMGKIVNPKED